MALNSHERRVLYTLKYMSLVGLLSSGHKLERKGAGLRSVVWSQARAWFHWEVSA